MAEVVCAIPDRDELARLILAQPDAVARVAALLAASSRLNHASVQFVENPTRCANVEELGFAQALLVEVVTRLGENDREPLPSTVTPRVHTYAERAVNAIGTVHRACQFARVVWAAAGGEVTADQIVRVDGVTGADVTPGCSGKPH